MIRQLDQFETLELREVGVGGQYFDGVSDLIGDAGAGAVVPGMQLKIFDTVIRLVAVFMVY